MHADLDTLRTIGLVKGGLLCDVLPELLTLRYIWTLCFPWTLQHQYQIDLSLFARQYSKVTYKVFTTYKIRYYHHSASGFTQNHR